VSINAIFRSRARYWRDIDFSKAGYTRQSAGTSIPKKCSFDVISGETKKVFCLETKQEFFPFSLAD
jgi:hypothetical protein